MQTVVTATDNTACSSSEAPQRRRGAALEDAILDAAWEELTEAGYAAFSVENVAARARTGKASIYRRWPAKAQLVMDALGARLPPPADVGLCPSAAQLDDTVTTADALRMVGNAIAAIMTSPAGRAVRAVKLEAATDPELARLVDDQFQAPRREALLRLLERGIARGEVRPGAATPEVADVLPAVLMHRVLMQQEPVHESHIQDVIETVLIPLVEVR